MPGIYYFVSFKCKDLQWSAEVPLHKRDHFLYFVSLRNVINSSVRHLYTKLQVTENEMIKKIFGQTDSELTWLRAIELRH